VKNTVNANKFFLTCFCILLFWYLAQFPGRLGFDYSEMIRMIRSGKSTDWWTSEFFWFVKIFSFGGQTLVLLSALQIVLLSLAYYRLIKILIQNSRAVKIVTISMFANPIFGNTAINISHDAYLVVGIFLVIELNIFLSKLKREMNSNRSSIWYVLSAIGFISLSFSQLGRIILLCEILYLVYKRNLNRNLVLGVVVSAVVSLTTYMNVDHFDKSSVLLPLVFDIKCICQHPEAEISTSQWKEIEKLAPKNEWLIATSCKLGDAQVAVMPSLRLDIDKSDFIKMYLEIVRQNPAIFLMAHFQRASVALPPPFFYGPENQVKQDPNLPIGLDSNIALQQGTQLLHPSVDEPSVSFKIPLFLPLEVVAQTLIFIINQASWFWGWGGLWLYPIMFFYFSKNSLRKLIPDMFPILVLHVALLLVGPGSFGRYVLSTIILGISLATAQIYDLKIHMEKKKVL
jgi:hypothetical protein